MTQILSEEQSEVHDAESKGRLNLKTFAADLDSAELVDLANTELKQRTFLRSWTSGRLRPVWIEYGVCGTRSED